MCEDTNECQTECTKPGEMCVNKLGGFECFDKNECSEGGNECNENNSKCSDTIGTYTCDCFLGYQVEQGNVSCSDIDECTDMLHDCSINATCKNTGELQSVHLYFFVTFD